MSWPAYTELRDSGIEDLGQVPNGWRPTKLRHVLLMNPAVPSKLRRSTDEVTFLPMEAIGEGGSLDLTRSRPVQEVLTGYSYFANGDVVFAKVTPCFENGKGALVQQLPSIHGFGTTEITTLRPGPHLMPRFLGYLIRSDRFRQSCIAAMTGAGGLKRVPDEHVRQFWVAIPPVSEQEQIADFLGAETARVDALISKQEQLIATLQKSRSTTVDLILDQQGFTIPRSLVDLESVTPPEGWRVIRLGTVLRQLTNGFVGPTRDILVDDGVPYIQSTHIKQGRIEFNRRPFYVRQEWHDERPRIHLREGDVLIVQTGDIGKVAVVPPNFGEASCHALQIARVKPEIMTGSYLGAFLSSWIGYHQLCSMATGALHPHLEAGIRAVSVVVPPLDIQSKIVRQASAQTAKIDELAVKASEVINTLQEYRSALITDAVTGKIDVRAVA